MSELDDSFARLLGRQPTDAERQQLYRVKDALGLDISDALWQVLFVLQFYQTQYEKMPAEIARVVDEVTTGAKVAAQAEAHAAMQTVKAELMKAVANSDNKVAHKGAGKGKTQWIDVCFVVVIVCLAFLAGDQHAWGQAYQKMLVEEVVAEWAFTPEGQEAYELAQAGPGNIKRLARCEGKGWYKKSDETGTVCIPASDKDGTLSGWKVP